MNREKFFSGGFQESSIEQPIEKAIVQDKTYFLQMKEHPWLSIGSFIIILLLWGMVAADAGIDFMILTAADLMQTKKLMVGLIILSLLGIFFNWLFQRLEHFFIPWKQ